MDLCLIPEPVSVDAVPGSYTFDRSAAILLSPDAEPGEWVSAHALQSALSGRGAEVVTQQHSPGADDDTAIILAVAERDREMLSETAPPSNSSSPEAYRLSIRPGRIEVAGATPAGLAQGTRTLIQLLSTAETLPCLTIEDAPALPLRGVMLDISRGKVPSLATLQTIVDVIASFKLNMLQLYMENTFAFPTHPRIGEGWGALTPEEVRTLDAYCRDRYVELVPCFQSLGHHRRLLSLPEYAHLSHSPEEWTLTPGEETWQLLAELYDDLLPCFSSRFVNICCDEPFDLTHTSPLSYEAAIGYAGGSETAIEAAPDDAFLHGTSLYLAHIQRLYELLSARGKTMMLWDDIFQQAPDMLAQMPADVIFLCWFYEAAEAYVNPETMRRAGKQSIVCPGTSSWGSLFARIDNARGNIRQFIRDGLAAGSAGVLVTDWGDDGHPNFLAASWYGYAYAASEGWAPGRIADREFDRRFARLFFGAGEADAALEALRLLSAACTLPGINKMNGSCSRAMFFRDPIADELTSLASNDSIERMQEKGARALDLLAPLRGVDAERAQTLDEMRLAARQIIHAARRTRAGRRLTNLAADNPKARRQLHAELDGLKRELHELRWDYQRLWLARNRPEGIWLTLDQFDTAALVLDRWRSQVAPIYSHSQ